ncbi:MAG: peptide-methionine (S)-S-oxide reductase MsrA [Deltaproteobacteria bacterium]|nr:peptide-methionine (S)-S-oxide reductase MsrA [Deltaproteobacteria bacterium]
MFGWVSAKDKRKAPLLKPAAGQRVAIFAGGCFWCMQPPFDKTVGVVSTTVGFVGGNEVDPQYDDVARGKTGHTEAIYVIFEPKQVSYEKLLEVYWRNIDPTDKHGQFVDRGSQYRPGIFYLNAEQRRIAVRSRDALARSGRFSKPIAVEISAAGRFWPAENYHQKFYKKDPTRYYSYRRGSGRDAFIARSWGDKH